MKKLYPLAFALLIPTFLFSQYYQDVSNAHGMSTYDPGFAFIGTGVSFADFNSDGLDDLTFGTADGDDIFFLQNINGILTPIAPLVTHQKISKQILWVDIDNDGDKDLFVTTFQDGYNRLYENTGGMNLIDITLSAGLLVDYASESNSAAFGDFDKDGFLDLYIGNTDSDVGGYQNKLYRNNGNNTFTDVTAATGTGNGNSYTLGNAFLDVDNDGTQDIYVANDRLQYPNALYQNNGNSTFTDNSVSSNSDISIAAMNVGVGDYDNDCDLDIYVTNDNTGVPGSALLQNDGNGNFTEVAVQAGVKFLGRTGWGGNWFDMDNDTDLDLYVCSVVANVPAQSNLLYENNGNGTFSTPLPFGLPNDQQNSYSNAYGDFNNDGKLDLVVANSPFSFITTPDNHRLWENVIPTLNNWIKIDLVGKISNHDGVGSWVELYAGGNKYLRYKHCGQGYLAQNADALHFGIGANIQIDSVVVKWLSGNIDVIVNPPINTTFEIIEGFSIALANDLISFEVKTNRNKNAFNIEWTAENETTTTHYLLQRSLNGIDYETISEIQSKNEITPSNYTYQDEKVIAGKLYYYKLKIFDGDGSFYFSKVITNRLIVGDNTFISDIFPNPAQDNIQFEITALSTQNANYEFINNNGQVILSKTIQLEQGSNHISLPIDRVENGVSFLRLHLENEVITKRFLKSDMK